jgi:hypothetical protein
MNAALTDKFYEGIWLAFSYMTLDSRADHVDLRVDDADLDYACEGATVRGLIEYAKSADEGGVVEEVLLRDDDGHQVVRFIDCQAGPNYMISPERLEELKAKL